MRAYNASQQEKHLNLDTQNGIKTAVGNFITTLNHL